MKTVTLWVLSVSVFISIGLLPLPTLGKQHINSASPHVSAGHGASLPALHTPTPNANPQPAAVTPSLCTRTDAVEAAILQAISASVTCQNATASQLGGITELDLSNTNIGTLKSGDFANLTNLTTLDLRYARLTSLPADIFSPLTNLTNLNLHSNQLASLPATLFNGLTKLHTLDLHNNWLTSLPTPTPPATGTTTYTGLLNHLTALQHLYLYGNRLSSLPAGLLAGLTNLATLNFSSNRISPLPLSLHIAPAAGSNLLTGTSVTAKIALPAGAPQALTIPLTITGGTPISPSLSIAKGATESAAFTITRTGSSTTVVSFGTLPTFLAYNPGANNVSISGLALSGASLTLFNDSKPTFSATPAAATHEQNSRITPRQLPAATGGNGALTYSLTATASNGGTLDNSNLPTGLAFDDQSRILSGTPTVTGTYSMTYKVQDADSSTGASDEDSRTFTLTVTAAATLPYTPVCDRTTAVRDALLAAIPGVSACANAASSHLLSITSLNLASKSIASLKAGDFSGLPNLTNLQLHSNSIATLPSGLLAGLDELASLSLRDNLLTSLPANIFQDLTSLRILELHNNHLGSVDGAAFAGLSALRELYLNNNRLTALPATLFADLSSLTILHLNQNRIATLPATLLNGLTTLQTLNLHNNWLTSLPTSLLAGLTNLTTLNFSNNRTSPLPLSLHIAPAGGSDLLTGTSITAKIALPIGAPQALTIPLTITGGSLSSSSLSIAKGATESTASFTITRTGNSTTAISFGALPTFLANNNPGTNNVSISGLTLSGTPLTLFNNSKPTFSATPAAATHEQNSRITPRQLPAATGGNGALTYSLTATASNGGTLDNSSNLPTGLAFGTQSRILSGTPTATGTYSMTYKVEDADTTAGAGDEDSRTFTLTVTAAETRPYTPVCDRTTAVRDALVAAIPGVSACANAASSHLLSITSLNLASKSIASLKAGDFSGLPNLTNLQLHSNSIATLPASLFAGLDELVSLSLRDNLLTALPANIFQDLTYLRILWLHNNRLGSIDGTTFAGLSALRELYLNNNRLTTLPATLFADLSSLTVLHLGQNRVATLPAPTGSAGNYSGLFNGLRSLKRLYLNSNRLTGLNGNSFRGLAELTHLSLRNNRLATLPTGNNGNGNGNGNGFLSDSSKLQSLWLYGNQLSSLPDDLLTGLDSLTELLLHSNAVATFTLPVQIEATPQGNEFIVNLRLPLAAPRRMSIEVTVDGSDRQVDFQSGPVKARSHLFSFQPGETTPRRTATLLRPSSSSNVVLNMVTPLPDLGDRFTGLVLTANPTLRFSGPSQTLSFGTATVPPQTYAAGRPIATLTLPAATASTGTPTITYDLLRAPTGILSGARANLTWDGTARTLTGTPITSLAPHSDNLIYTASSDGYRSASLRFSIDYVANTAPTFEANTTISDQTIKKDEEIAMRLPPAKNGNWPLTYELAGIIKTGTSAGTISDGLPAGLYFNAGERLLSGQPSALGSYTMTYKVTDLDGESATLPSFTLSIVVSKAGTRPTFSQSSIATQYLAQNLTTQPLQLPEASGGDGLLTYSLTPQVPGLTFNPNNSTLTGSATTLGTTRLTYKVADSDSDNTASDTSTLIFDLQVYAAATFTDASLHDSEQAHAVNQSGFSLQLPAATGGRGTLSYALTGTLPAGLAFTAATRTLAGTPTQAERRLLYWTVTDSAGFGTQISFDMRINTPVAIAQAQYNFNLLEKLDGSTISVLVGEKIAVIDPDRNDPLSATLSSLSNNNFNFITYQGGRPNPGVQLAYEGTGEDLDPLGVNNTRDLTLTVSDGASTATTNITVTIIAANQKPVAEAGPDQTVIPTSDASQRTTLDGSGSTDPESHSLTYVWTAPGGITLQSASTARPWFNPHIAAGDYDFSLTVTDIPGGSATPLSSIPDTVRVTVGHGTPYFKNASGTVITSQSLSAKQGNTAGTDVGSPVLASDPNGGTIASYSLADTTTSSGHAANFQVSAGGQISVASGKTLSTLTSYAVTLTAGKGSGATARSGSIALTIAVIANDPPVLDTAIPAQSLARGGSQTITLSNHFSDSDSTLSYSATSDNTKVLTVAVSNAGVLTLTAKSDAGGSADVTVTASDGLASVEDSFTVTVANNAPTVSAAIADQSNLTIGDSVAITLSDHFTDTDSGDTLTYSHSLTPANSGVATAAQTSVGGKPTLTLTAASKGSLTVAVTATDNGGTASVSDSFDLTVTNTTPTIVGKVPTQLVPPGGSVGNIDLPQYFNDAEGKNSLTYTASSGDTSTVTTSISTDRLTITARPLPAANSATVTVTATDDRNKTATQTFSVEIKDVAPSFSGTVGDQSYTKDAPISALQLPKATGGNGALTYSLDGTLPPGLAFTTATRTLTGTPTALGTTTMTYTAADSDSNSQASDLASQTFDIVVLSAPVFTDTSLHGSTLNLVTDTPGFRLQLPLAKPNLGTPSPDYYLSGNLPQGLQYDGANHTLTGSPVQAGSYPNLVWSITDSQGASTSLTFTIVVALNSYPSFASADQSLTALAKTNFQIALPTASGGNGTLTYSLTGEPAGTRFDASAHTLNGTLADATSHSLTLRVRDDDSDSSDRDSATLALTLRVQPNLCDRTQQVWEALLGNGQCDASATAEDLRSHLVLTIDDPALTNLQAGDFGGLVNLQTLIVEGTQLASLPANLFADLPQLETLVLSGNRLSSLPDGLFVASNAAGAGFNAAIGSSSVPKLAFLDLSDNALTSLPADLFSGLNSGLLTLDLSGNPGAPFVLSIELQQVALPTGGAYDPQTDINLRARLSMTAPLQLSLPLVLSDPTAATLSCAALTVAVGASQSDSCVLRLIGQQAVQVALASSLALPVEYQGLRLQIGDPLQLSTSRAADTAFQQQMLARNALTVATSVARSIGERMNYWKNGSPAGLQVGTNSGGSSFALPLDRLDAERGANGTLAIWGQSLKGELDSRDQELNFSGDVPTLHLGVDGRLGDNLVLGMVVSQASASFDFSAAQNLSGQYDSDLQSFHPYVGWNSGPVQLWASVGSGSGDLTLGVAGGDGLSDTASLSTVQLGLVAPLLKGSTKLWVQADFTQAGMQLDSGMSADASQARLALRVAHSFRFRGGGALTPRLEVASRSDGGDIQGGNGQETGYSLNYDSGAGFTLGLGGRQLLSSVSLDSTQDSYEETGSWLAVEYRTGDDGRGLSLALRPAEGVTESGLQRLWQQPASATAATLNSSDTRQLAAELGYGLATGSGALWTPRGALLQGQGGQRQWRLGVALGIGDGMDMAVEGEWTDDAGKANTPLLKAAPLLKVRGQWRF